MTNEELEVLLTQAADPNTAPVALSSLRDNVRDLISNVGTLTAQTQADAKTIADLRDVNMRLFLKTGSGAETGGQEEEHEETVEELNERLRKTLRGE